MKETMIELFEAAKLALMLKLENAQLTQEEIDDILDSLIEVAKLIKKLKEN